MQYYLIKHLFVGGWIIRDVISCKSEMLTFCGLVRKIQKRTVLLSKSPPQKKILEFGFSAQLKQNDDEIPFHLLIP